MWERPGEGCLNSSAEVITPTRRAEPHIPAAGRYCRCHRWISSELISFSMCWFLYSSCGYFCALSHRSESEAMAAWRIGNSRLFSKGISTRKYRR